MADQVYQDILPSIKWRRFIIVVFLIWGFITLLTSFRSSVYQLSIGNEVQWLHIFFFNFNAALLWVFLTPFLMLFALKVFAAFDKWYQVILSHLILAIVLAPLHTFLFLCMDFFVQNQLKLWTKVMSFKAYFSSYFIELIFDGLLTYAVIAGLLTGYLLFLRNQNVTRKQEQLEKNLLQSRVTNLKYQLQPHFLFNGMQTISNLLYKDVTLADQAIANLSDILRFSINQLTRDYISLKAEIDITIKYLDFLQLRFDQKVSYSISAPEELYPYQVPALLLQPLVENAVKHGFEATGKPIKIEITVSAESEKLVFDIIDNGPGFNAPKVPGREGTGLKNLGNRLQYLYPNHYELNILSIAKGSHIQIKIDQTN